MMTCPYCGKNKQKRYVTVAGWSTVALCDPCAKRTLIGRLNFEPNMACCDIIDLLELLGVPREDFILDITEKE